MAERSASRTANSSGEAQPADSPEQAFADVIKQISAEATAPQAPKTASGPGTTVTTAQGIPNRGIFAVLQTGTPRFIPNDESAATLPADVNVTKPASKKESGSPANTLAAGSAGVAAATLIDVVVPTMPVKPRLFDSAEAGGTQQADAKVENRSQTEAAAALPPEAVLTVVIRSDETAQTVSDRVAAARAQDAENARDVPQASTTGDDSAPVGGGQYEGQYLLSAPVTPTLVSSLSALSPDVPWKKVSSETSATSGSLSDLGTAHGPQTTSFQDLQIKSEPAKVAESNLPRNDAPRLPSPPAEPALAEKTPAQPLKSLALEFTPDGARDVRVRLSERAGEVHVSLHSSDPSITKNLRDGVTDLASVLAHAGYDAKAWTSGRQQQENPQQGDEPNPRRRGTGAGGDRENFDGVMQGDAAATPIQETL